MGRIEKILLSLCLCLAAGAVVLLIHQRIFNSGSLVAMVEQNGKRILSIDLMQLEEPLQWKVESEWGYNVIDAEQGRIAVTSADCPGNECVSTGWLSRPGDVSICLPHRLSVRILGKGELDGTAH